jgi:hypothetical protein
MSGFPTDSFRIPPRSFSVGFNPAKQSWRPPNIDVPRRVHLIPCDLWEAITGEHLSPDHICRLCDVLTPGIDAASQREISLQYLNLAKDRTGSRILQQRIQDCSPCERKQIFDSLLPHLSELIFDPSSNYVIQKLCDFPTTETQSVFLSFFLSDIHRIVEHQNGCRVLQKFIENTIPVNVDQLFQSLKSILISLSYSANGNHIVQRFIELLPFRLQEIVAQLEPQVTKLVIDNCGCRVIQRLFEQYNITDLRPLVDQVMQCAGDLAMNQYGNYVVQNILESGPDEDVTQLIQAFTGRFYQFSMHKFASNVIEKCIRRASASEKERIFTEIIGLPGKWETGRIVRMASDQFGNYVIQRIIEFGSELQQTGIYDVVYQNFDELIGEVYARHVISRLEDQGFGF